MKRLICFILILIFAFPFVSCAVAEEEKSAPGTKTLLDVSGGGVYALEKEKDGASFWFDPEKKIWAASGSRQMDYSATGPYEIRENVLICKSTDGNEIWAKLAILSPEEIRVEEATGDALPKWFAAGQTCFFLPFDETQPAKENGILIAEFHVDPEDNEKYFCYLTVIETDENGFLAEDREETPVYVNFQLANQVFQRGESVKAEFCGSRLVNEEKTITLNVPYRGNETIVSQKVLKTSYLYKLKDGEYDTHRVVLFAKPILYFYPEEETKVSVELELDGEFTCTYPAYGENGWKDFTASPDGTLTFPDGKRYYALYWEGVHDKELDFSRGFCVKGSDAAAFLEEILPKLGLNFKEANEFIVYWLPKLQENPYNLIAFQGKGYTDHARLAVTPEPDTLIRVLMAYQPLNAPVQIEPQKIETPERRGFTVVEWGGCEV